MAEKESQTAPAGGAILPHWYYKNRRTFALCKNVDFEWMSPFKRVFTKSDPDNALHNPT